MRIALVGGEPLLHPDVVEIVRYCRKLGFATSLTTNGFLLTRKLLKELEEAGLQVMQISVDRMTPSPVTKKSFKTILPQFDYFKDSKISHIRARPRRGSEMSGHVSRIRDNRGFAKSEALHDPQQTFEKRNTEKRAERVRSVGEK